MFDPLHEFLVVATALCFGWNADVALWGIRDMIKRRTAFDHREFREWTVAVGFALVSGTVLVFEIIR